jgi:hypothetical protein
MTPWISASARRAETLRHRGHSRLLKRRASFGPITSADWFHDHLPRAQKTAFIHGPTGEIGRQPGHGIVLVGMGQRSCVALQNSWLGIYVTPDNCGAVDLESMQELGAPGL